MPADLDPRAPTPGPDDAVRTEAQAIVDYASPLRNGVFTTIPDALIQRLKDALEAAARVRSNVDPEALTIADYEQVLSDKRRLTRELDVALHGEAGAAKQASLCDLIGPAAALRNRADTLARKNAALLAILRQVEWNDNYLFESCCPVCHRTRRGHASNCALASALRDDAEAGHAR